MHHRATRSIGTAVAALAACAAGPLDSDVLGAANGLNDPWVIMTAATTKALHALRQLACMGVPMETAFVDATTVLSRIVPFETWSMVGLDHDLRPRDFFASDAGRPQILARYAQRWFDRDEGDYYPTQTRMQTDPRHRVVRVSDFSPRFAETELYDEIFRGDQHSRIAGVALYAPGRPIGNLGIGRPTSAKDFSDAEMVLLDEARPLLVQAFSQRGEQCPRLGPTGMDETAMLLCDAEGAVQSESQNAWRLLRWAAGVPADEAVINDPALLWARPVIGELVTRVERGMQGREGPVAAMRRVNRYGEFILRAYAMEGALGPRRTAYGVQIERHTPIALQLFSEPAFLSPSNRAQMVCRLVVQGVSQAEMAHQLGVKPSTVVSHVRNLYDRLEVCRREDVASAVMSLH